MSARHLLLACALGAFATTASAGLTLLAPRAGDRLEGGSDATIRWTATSLPAHVDEWEAFLSVDGGAYYPVRITPHLDVGIRTFRFRVPNVATTRARLLLRIGDESDELRVELPQTFTIVAHAATIDFRERHTADATQSDGAVEWVERDLVRHRRDDSSASDVPCITATCGFEEAAENVMTDELRVMSASLHDAHHSSPVTHHSSLLVRPLLLLSTRLNI
jgi:hypothetical protein